MLALYNIGIFLYGIAIRIAALFNQKAKDLVEGRTTQKISNTEHNCIWMHCASLGEYEQGFPILQELRKQFPNTRIVVSFYSPSGYNYFKANDVVNEIYYLPLDTKQEAQSFIDQLKPQVAVFVKYEFWYHHLAYLHAKKIPTYLVSGMLRDKPFLSWYGSLHRKMLSFFTHLFLQNESVAAIANKIGLHNYSVTGDSRNNKVVANKDASFVHPLIEEFCKQHEHVLVAGSTWPTDEEIICLALANAHHYAAIIAPHNVNEKSIKALQELFPNASLLSSGKLNDNASVLIIDQIGLLNKLYRFATCAYIGGGFGHGIHNVLEAAVYNKLLFCGPNINKFNEALELRKIGVLQVVHTSVDLQQRLNKNQQISTTQIAQLQAYFTQNTQYLAEIVAEIAKNL
jgi:3-deoxy-D-manno-octulosonic-acid transferase